MRLLKWLASIATAAVVVACGGGDGDSTSTTPPPNPPPQPASPSYGTGTFQPNAKLMPETDLAGATLTDDALTVKKPQSEVHTVGTVLVVDGFGGRLVRITQVQQSASEVRYGYEPASLAQAFATLDVKFLGELTPADLGDSFVTNDPEVEIAWRDVRAQTAQASREQGKAISVATNTIEIKYKKVGAQIGGGIEIDGSSSFVMNPDFSLNLNKRAGDTLPSLDMTATISPSLQTSLSIASLYGGQVGYVLEKTIRLKPFSRPIIVPVFGVPVPVPFWIQPVVNLSGGVNGTAGSKFTTTYGYGISGSLGFNRTGAAGLDGIASLSSTSDLNVTDVESEFGVTLNAPRLELQFLIYSAAGPNFEMGYESAVLGKGATEGSPPVEGVKVDGNIKFKAAVGLKGGIDFQNISALKSLLGDLSFSYAPVMVTVYESTVRQGSWFFPYSGLASVSVYDNGSAPDDIFEIALDGVALGRTNKGGSGQFRLKNLRPGNHTLTLTTVEDDSPPGTYAIALADGLTFASGGTSFGGTAALGQPVQFGIVVPDTKAP